MSRSHRARCAHNHPSRHGSNQGRQRRQAEERRRQNGSNGKKGRSRNQIRKQLYAGLARKQS